jgi:hypothetical protein
MLMEAGERLPDFVPMKQNAGMAGVFRRDQIDLAENL